MEPSVGAREARAFLAQLALKLDFLPAPPRAGGAVCDRCGPLRQGAQLILILTYVHPAGWICDACLAVPAPPGREISPAGP